MTITGIKGYSTSNTFTIPNLALPIKAGPGTKHISGVSLGKVKPKLRPPPPLTPAPKLMRTESTNPLPLLEGMVKPILKPDVHKKVLKKAMETVNQEKSQNPRSRSNPTLDIFSQDATDGVAPAQQKKSKLSKKTPKKSATVLIKTPDPARKNSPYRYKDESLSPPAAPIAKKSPERSKSPVVRQATVTRRPTPHKPSSSRSQYNYPSSSSQSSQEYIDDSDIESNKSHTSSSEQEDEAETEVFDDPDFQPPPKSYRYSYYCQTKFIFHW